MKFSVISVLCILSVCVYQCDAFKIIQKIKDYFHPTTTVVVPTLNELELTELTEKDNSTYEGTTAQIHHSHTYVSEDQDGEYSLTPQSHPSTDGSNERPYTPQNFPTIAPPAVPEIYPGMRKQTTTPRSTDNPNTPPGQSNVDYYKDNQEISTTPQTNVSGGFYDQITSEQTPFNTVVDYNFQTTTSKISVNLNTNTFKSNENRTFNTKVLSGEKPIVQPSSTNKHTSSSSTNDNFVFPDDPILNEVDPEGSHTSLESTSDRPSTPVTRAPVGVNDPRYVANAPSKDCEKGKRLDNKGNCQTIARK